MLLLAAVVSVEIRVTSPARTATTRRRDVLAAAVVVGVVMKGKKTRKGGEDGRVDGCVVDLLTRHFSCSTALDMYL